VPNHAPELRRLWAKFFDEESALDFSSKESLANAIGSFPKEDHSLASIPAYAKANLGYPSSYNPPLEGPPPPAEQVWPYVPGECWIA